MKIPKTIKINAIIENISNASLFKKYVRIMAKNGTKYIKLAILWVCQNFKALNRNTYEIEFINPHKIKIAIILSKVFGILRPDNTNVVGTMKIVATI